MPVPLSPKKNVIETRDGTVAGQAGIRTDTRPWMILSEERWRKKVEGGDLDSGFSGRARNANGKSA